MAKVFRILDDSYGFLALATTPNAVAHWLIDNGWVHRLTQCYHEEEMKNISLEDLVPDSYMGEWENWFIDQVEENGAEFLENLGFQMVEEELVGDVEDLLPRGRFG